MPENSRPCIQIDLNEFKLHIYFKDKTQLTLHFNSPSRRFYLSVVALVVSEMKRSGKIKPIPLWEHLDLLSLLNESVGGAAGSSEKENLLHRIYTKWTSALPNLEEAPLFKVLGRKKEEGDGAVGKVYSFTDEEKDGWANLFGYMGSDENLRVKFAIDKIGIGLGETLIIFMDYRNGEAWDQFIASLKKEGMEEKKEGSVPVEETAGPEPPAVPLSPPEERNISWLIQYRWVLLVVVIGIVAGAIWKIFLSPVPVEVASKEKMAFPLPDVPSIAVLPFANMSEDPKQEFLSDGMTEAIITALSRVPRMFVISRNSTFTYKGKPLKVKQVSEDLGVRYVLEGSLQRSGDRVRVTVQLIDAITGNHLWADRYDRDLKDIFALQDEITLKILAGVQAKLIWGGEILSAQQVAEKHYRGKQGLDCYLRLMEAHGYRLRWTNEGNNLARRMVEEAIAMCPENPMGYNSLGWVHHTDYLLGNTKSPRETLEKGIELAQRALAMDDSLAVAHALLSNLYSHKREYDKAIAEGERAVALDPGGISALNGYACGLMGAGKSEEAISIFQKAIRFSPFGPSFLYNNFGWALQNTGRFEEAVSARKKAVQIAPDDILAHTGLAITYIMMGREDQARAEAAEVLRINPKYLQDPAVKDFPPKDQSEADKVDAVLREVGMPALNNYALSLNYAGKPEEAIPFYEKAIRLSPLGTSYLYRNLGVAFRNTGRLKEAESALKKAIQLEPDNINTHIVLATTYIMMGREKEARAEAAEVLRINPKFSVDSWAKTFTYKDQSQQTKIVNALRKAGLK